MKGAYYNEIDKYAAQWLRNLIAAGHIAPGDVDERSITDVTADDIRGYTQCHFFAGIGGWSRALRLAGWADDRRVWTGSCPCQPFSTAGKGAGTSDERHLWPIWFNLIEQCGPNVIFGEQVEAAINHGWLDLVCSDLESKGYSCAPVGLSASSVGAPHVRQRLWFVADSPCEQWDERLQPLPAGPTEWVGGDSFVDGWSGSAPARRLGDADDQGPQKHGRLDELYLRQQDRAHTRRLDVNAGFSSGATFWSDADWLPFRDGKTRPVEPGTFPLANGVSGRVGRLRAYGNAIVPQVAAEVIGAYMDHAAESHVPTVANFTTKVIK